MRTDCLCSSSDNATQHICCDRCNKEDHRRNHNVGNVIKYLSQKSVHLRKSENVECREQEHDDKETLCEPTHEHTRIEFVACLFDKSTEACLIARLVNLERINQT